MTVTTDNKKIILVHAQPIISRGIKFTLESGGYPVHWACEDIEDAICFCDNHQIDLMIVGIAESGSEEMDFIYRCRRQNPAMGIVVISDSCDSSEIENLLQNGINSFVLSGSSEKELLMAVSAAENNERYLCARPNKHTDTKIDKDQSKKIWNSFRPVLLAL